MKTHFQKILLANSKTVLCQYARACEVMQDLLGQTMTADTVEALELALVGHPVFPAF